MWHREFAKILIGVSLFCLTLPGRADAAEANGIDLQFSLKVEPFTVTVSGKVTDKATGAPLAGALVRGHIVIWKYEEADLYERCPYSQTRTDAQGIYKLEFVTELTTSGLKKGRDGLCVYASAPGHETKPVYAEPPVTPESTEYRDLNFELEPGQRIAGTVVDTEGRPVPEALVRLQDGNNGDVGYFGALGRATTNERGQFELWVAKSREQQWLSLVKQGCGTLFVWDNLDTGDLGTLVLNRGGSIQGRIVDPAGKAVAGCEVSVHEWPCYLVDKVLTDSDGRYLLQGVPGDPSIIEFFTRKNGHYVQGLSDADVYARLDPNLLLANAPTYQILTRDSAMVTGPDLVVGRDVGISGRLTGAHHVYSLGGLLVRLDHDWSNIVEADADGNFQFPLVSPGKHSLAAYLPHDLPYGDCIGQAEIDVAPGRPLTGVQILLEDLAEVRVQFLDGNGNPLPGIIAGATSSPDGRGGLRGTKSDADGWAVLYLHPGEVQYVHGFDAADSLVPETCERVQPRAGQILDSLRIVMVSAASLHAQITDANQAPLVGKTALCTLTFADGVRMGRGGPIATEGHLNLEGLTPGIVKLSIEIDDVLFEDVTTQAFELKPGATKDLGRLTLKSGFDKEAVIRDKNAHALDYAAEVRQAAAQLLERIRTADYQSHLQKTARVDPLGGYYQTYTRRDLLIEWICTTFSKNPIVKVELGDVFLSPEEINDKKNLPTVPYKITLKDGTRLEGNLPFEFCFIGDEPHWHGLLGIDWHLNHPKQP